MAAKHRKRGEEVAVKYTFPEEENGGYIAYENMYRDYSTDTDCIESFPGYRRLISLGGRINGIFPERREDGSHYLVHAGNTLYRCTFGEKFLDSFTSEALCDMEDHESASYRHGDSVYIFDSCDVTVIGIDGEAKKASEYEELIYVPTTYKNGEEYEQANVLTSAFREEFYIESADEISYESIGLFYRITSEANKTCEVSGYASGLAGRVDIPGRKLINGTYYRVSAIAPSAFRGATGITSVIVGPNVKTIGDEAFLGCTSLTMAMLGEGCSEIGSFAFSQCSSLAKIYLGTKTESIGSYAFINCDLLTTVYFYGTNHTISNINGIEELASATIYYKCKFVDKFAAVPICTPAYEISEITLDGEECDCYADVERGIIKIGYSAAGELEGKRLSFTGYADTEIKVTSARGVPFSVAYSDVCTPDEAVMSCCHATVHDGRFHLCGSSAAKNVIFSSSYTASGITHPLYFGALDYTAVGSPESAVTSLCPIGSRLAAIKRSEDRGGRIYVLRPEGRSGALYGRRLYHKHTYEGESILSDGYSFGGSLIFLTARGVMRLVTKSDLSPVSVECLSEDFTSKINPADFPDARISTLCGYLAIFSGGTLLLGDKRRAYQSDSGDTQFRWYTVSDVQSHLGESPVYYYADTAPEGYYIHPDEGKATDGEVYSYVDSDGVKRYYAKVGLLRYAVVPGTELFGGEGGSVSAACEMEASMLFGTEEGDVFAFNTDKRGVPPKEIYSREDFSEEEYSSSFGRVIHPYHYSAAGHRMRYGIRVLPLPDDGTCRAKSDVRGSLTVKLERRSSGMITVLSVIDGDEVRELAKFPLGGLDFEDLDFESLAMTAQNTEIHMIPDNARNYAEKQIIVYTDDYLSPFAIQSLSYAYRIKGRVRNE